MFKQIALLCPNVPLTASSHLFWRRYPIRISVIVTEEDIQNFDAYHFKSFIRSALPAGSRILSTGWIMNRRFSCISVFLSTPQEAAEFVSRIGLERCTQITAPETDEHHSMMCIANVIIRKSLFCGKYRYRMKFQSLNLLERNQTSEYCQDAGNDRAYLKHQWPPTLYFRDEEDVVFVKLMHGELVTSIDKVILKSEILHGCDASAPPHRAGCDSTGH